MKKKTLFWVVLFGVIFLMTQDYYLWVGTVELGILGFPRWMAWVLLLQLLFVGAMIAFARHYWREDRS